MRRGFGVFAVGLAIVAGPAGRAEQESGSKGCPASAKLSRLVADSHLIVAGSIPDRARNSLLAAPERSYVSILLEVEKTLKGNSPSTLTVRHYSEATAHSPSLTSLADSPGRLSIFFLTQVDENGPLLYFAGHTPDAFAPATGALLAAVRTEIQRQGQVVSTWLPDSRLPHFEEVRRLVSRLGEAQDEEQRRIFKALEELGSVAVPAIIAVMDDRRPLRSPYISLVNRSPNAFEGVRHYGPELVVDALAAILGQITGRSIGQIHNGGSERERDVTVAAWRVYAADLACPADVPVER